MHLVGSYYTNMSRCTVNKTLKIVDSYVSTDKFPITKKICVFILTVEIKQCVQLPWNSVKNKKTISISKVLSFTLFSIILFFLFRCYKCCETETATIKPAISQENIKLMPNSMCCKSHRKQFWGWVSWPHFAQSSQ